MKRRLGVERVERERVHAGHVVCLCDCLDRRHVRFSLTEPFEEVHGDNEPREPRRGDRDREVRAHVAQGGRVDPQRVAKSVRVEAASAVPVAAAVRFDHVDRRRVLTHPDGSVVVDRDFEIADVGPEGAVAGVDRALGEQGAVSRDRGVATQIDLG